MRNFQVVHLSMPRQLPILLPGCEIQKKVCRVSHNSGKNTESRLAITPGESDSVVEGHEPGSRTAICSSAPRGTGEELQEPLIHKSNSYRFQLFLEALRPKWQFKEGCSNQFRFFSNCSLLVSYELRIHNKELTVVIN